MEPRRHPRDDFGITTHVPVCGSQKKSRTWQIGLYASGFLLARAQSVKSRVWCNMIWHLTRLWHHPIPLPTRATLTYFLTLGMHIAQ